MDPKRFFQLAISTILLITGVTYWDYHRVDSDFNNLKDFLMQIRMQSLMDGKARAVRFDSGKVTATFLKDGAAIKTIRANSINSVEYETTVGKDMIVFSAGGTGEYNVRIHGGELELKSWFGHTKHMAINCTGLVTEGRYPDE